MASSWFLQDDNLGKITFTYYAKAKRLTLRVHSSRGIVVSVPKKVPKAFAESFVYSKREWIQEQLLKQPLSLITPSHTPQLPGHDWRWKANMPFRVGVRKKTLTIYYEEGDLEKAENQDSILKGVIRCWRHQAKEMQIRLEEISLQSGVKFNELRFKNMTSRWGSCSRAGNINISIFVVGLPEYLQDYILWHELTHILHPNHSQAFWDTLETFYPGALVYDREMKQYDTTIWIKAEES